MPATPYKDTAVVDQPWDGPAAESRASNEEQWPALYAWFDGSAPDPDNDGYPDRKGDFKFPHHQVDGNGNVGAANVNGVRAAMARLGNADIPAGDRAGVRAHLQKHLDRFNAGKKSDVSDLAAEVGWGVIRTEGKTWAITADMMPVLRELHGQVLRWGAADVEAVRGKNDKPSQPTGGVAVVDLQGVITPKTSLLSLLLGGGYGLDVFMGQMRTAMADPDVNAVVMNVDSPGGLVDGVPEAAVQLRDMRSQKPLVAVANTQSASAAYWLASQAHELVVTPSGEAGSVGVYSLHKDMSAALEQVGVKATLVSAGKYKVEGNPFEPLTQEGFDATKQAVDDFYGMFVADVSAGRGQEVDPSDVADGMAFGGGRMLTAKRAVKSGLADRVATLGDTVKRLQSGRARVRQTDTGAFEIAYGDGSQISAEADSKSNGGPRVWTPEERLGLLELLASR